MKQDTTVLKLNYLLLHMYHSKAAIGTAAKKAFPMEIAFTQGIENSAEPSKG